MSDSCGCPSEAGNIVCDLPAANSQRPPREVNACPECGKVGKPVQGQTIKAIMSVSLRQVQEVQYLFCRTQTCPVVYFSAAGAQAFTIQDVREGIYQKAPEADDVLICYCFRHTVGQLRNASAQDRVAIVDNINTGINAGQCACDLRNPQGSCCLGNVNRRIKQLEQEAATTS